MLERHLPAAWAFPTEKPAALVGLTGSPGNGNQLALNIDAGVSVAVVGGRPVVRFRCDDPNLGWRSGAR